MSLVKILNVYYRIPNQDQNSSKLNKYQYGFPFNYNEKNNECLFFVVGEGDIDWNCKKIVSNPDIYKIISISIDKLETGFEYQNELKWVSIHSIEIDFNVYLKINPFENVTPYLKSDLEKEDIQSNSYNVNAEVPIWNKNSSDINISSPTYSTFNSYPTVKR